MDLALHLPDDLVRVLPWQAIPRHVVAQIALEGYQAGHLSEEQVRRLRGYDTRLEVHGFLTNHDVPLRYTRAALEKARATHRRLGLYMLVVADTSPIHYLVLRQHDTLLPVRYERVVIPPAGLADLQRPRTPAAVRLWVTHPPAWCEGPPPRHPLDAQSSPKGGAGEREAIAFAHAMHVPLLIDDADGREVAERRARAALGTLGMVENAAIQELRDLPDALARLQATTLHARAELFQALLARDNARKRQGEAHKRRVIIPTCVATAPTTAPLCSCLVQPIDNAAADEPALLPPLHEQPLHAGVCLEALPPLLVCSQRLGAQDPVPLVQRTADVPHHLRVGPRDGLVDIPRHLRGPCKGVLQFPIVDACRAHLWNHRPTSSVLNGCGSLGRRLMSAHARMLPPVRI